MGMSIEEEVKNIKEQLADVSAKYRMIQSDYNAYNEFFKRMKQSDREFVKNMLEEYEKAESED